MAKPDENTLILDEVPAWLGASKWTAYRPTENVDFRVLKIDTSNMVEVYYAPDAVMQEGLFAAVDNIKQIFKLLSPATEVKCL